MSIDLIIVIPLPPRGKGAATPGAHGGMVKHAATRQWENSIAALAAYQMPRALIAEAVQVDILAVFARTQDLAKVYATGKPKHPVGLIPNTNKPDIDNIRKSAQDALKAHWSDDKLVVVGKTAKAWCELHGKPRLVLRIRSVGPDWLRGMTPLVEAKWGDRRDV